MALGHCDPADGRCTLFGPRVSGTTERLAQLLGLPGTPSTRNWLKGDVRDAAEDRKMELAGSLVPGDDAGQGCPQRWELLLDDSFLACPTNKVAGSWPEHRIP